MALELPVTYLQSVPLPQLPLSTAGLPSQTTGVSQVALTVMSIAHVFMIPEFERTNNNNSNHNSGASPSPSSPMMNQTVTNDEPVAKRKRVCLIIDPIASYTKDLDVAVARCVAASSVTSLRFQNEQALFGLRTSLHPLDIIVSHSTPADCIRVLPSILSWYRPVSNVIAATDNNTGWKAVMTKPGMQPPLPATFKLQHEMPADHTWYVNPYFSFTPPDDAEQGANDWMQLAHNSSQIYSNNNNSMNSPAGRASSFGGGSIPRGVGGLNTGDAGNSFSMSTAMMSNQQNKPPLGPYGVGAAASPSMSLSMMDQQQQYYSTGNSVLSPMNQNSNDIAWLLPHAKKDGGASERAAGTMLMQERHKNEVALTQLEAVKTSLEAEKAAFRSQKVAYENENGDLKKKIKELEEQLRTLRFDRIAAADDVRQLTTALKSSKEEKYQIQSQYSREQAGLSSSANKASTLTPEPLMISRPETLVGPIPTSLQNAGPSDAEVLAALMLQKSLKPPKENFSVSRYQDAHNNSFQSASASPIVSNANNLSLSRNQQQNNVGRRGPSPSASKKYQTQHNRTLSGGGGQHDISGTNLLDTSDVSQQQQKPPPSPLVIDSDLPLDPPAPRPAWNNVLGDTPEERLLDPYGVTHDAEAARGHATLVRSLLVKNSLPSPMQKIPANNNNNNNRGSLPSSRSSTPDYQRGMVGKNYDAATAASTAKMNQQHPTTSANYRSQANRNIRSGSPRTASSEGRTGTSRQQQQQQSPLRHDQGRAQATAASLYTLSNHLKAGRKLISDLRNDNTI